MNGQIVNGDRHLRSLLSRRGRNRQCNKQRCTQPSRENAKSADEFEFCIFQRINQGKSPRTSVASATRPTARIIAPARGGT
jgi:hypothetical protein